MIWLVIKYSIKVIFFWNLYGIIIYFVSILVLLIFISRFYFEDFVLFFLEFSGIDDKFDVDGFLIGK